MVYEIQGRSDYGNIRSYSSSISAYVRNIDKSYADLVRDSRERTGYGNSEYAGASDPGKFEISIPLSSFPVMRI